MYILCTAVAIVRLMGLKINPPQKPNKIKTEQRVTPWERWLRTKIEVLRKDVEQLTEYNGGERTRKLEKRVGEIISRTQTYVQYEPAVNSPCQCLDTLKHKHIFFSEQLRRYTASNPRKYNNILLEKAERTFYRKLDLPRNKTTNPTLAKITLKSFGDVIFQTHTKQH